MKSTAGQRRPKQSIIITNNQIPFATQISFSTSPPQLQTHQSKMSAPNPGRQSPDPENQSDAQAGKTTGNVNEQGGGVKSGAEKQSDDTKGALSSNPTHPLEKHAEETTSKK